jgi:hypothetical protein
MENPGELLHFLAQFILTIQWCLWRPRASIERIHSSKNQVAATLTRPVSMPYDFHCSGGVTLIPVLRVGFMVVITDAPAFPAMMASGPLARRKTLAKSVVWMDAAGWHV